MRFHWLLILADIYLQTVTASISCENMSGYQNCKMMNLNQYDEIDLTDMTVLDVKLKIIESNIPTLPPALMSLMPNLLDITAVNCGLKQINSEQDSTKTYSKLSVINVSRNKIRILANRTFLISPKLEKLNLSHNRISEIEENAFDGLTALTDLDLSNNGLTALHAGWFTALNSISELNFNKNQITTVDISVFDPNVNLENLDLANNQIVELTSQTVNNAIVDIDLKFNRLKEVTGLTFLAVLQKIDLSYNRDLDLDSVPLETWNFSLQTLSLNGLKVLKLTDLLPRLASLTNLLELNLEENSLAYLDFESFPVLENLDEMSLYGNKLSDINYGAVREKFPRLKFLNVSNNNWNCLFLARMKINLNAKKIAILPRNDESYASEDAIDGVVCENRDGKFVGIFKIILICIATVLLMLGMGYIFKTCRVCYQAKYPMRSTVSSNSIFDQDFIRNSLINPVSFNVYGTNVNTQYVSPDVLN